jgi:predicted nucleic acid-binding protein
MPARPGVLDLSIEPPEVVCVDTSALIRALFDDQPQHTDYLGFFVRIAEGGSTIVYSELLDLELAQMCVKSARNTSNGRRKESTRLGRELVRSTSSAWRDIYTLTGSVRVTLAGGDEPGIIGSPVRAAAFYLIEHNGIESYDATHAATAITYGAPILTADRDFADVPAERLEIITHPESVEEFRQYPFRV